MTPSSDFFADLERQLADATRERPQRLRRARVRRAATALAVLLALVTAGAALATTLATTGGDERRTPAAPTSTTDPALRNIDVAVLNGTQRRDGGARITDELARAGLSIVSVDDRPQLRGLTLGNTMIMYAPGHRRDAEAVQRIVLQAVDGQMNAAPITTLGKDIGRRLPEQTDVAVLAGDDTSPAATVAVLNATTVPGLARGVANRLQNAGERIGNVTNASDQTRRSTTIEYKAGHRADALRIARDIDVRPEAVSGVRHVRSVLVAGTEADVIVTVGSDQSTAPHR